MTPSKITSDAVALARDLIRCPSVTPAEAGALDCLQRALEAAGFTCWRLPYGEVDNLFARIGDGAPHLCFAGHTDVVPVGDEAGWDLPPFGGEEKDGELYGRGAVDMKGGVACFVAAALDHLAAENTAPAGSISLLITGDEEGPAVNGTIKVLDWMKNNGHVPDHCVVGEPTNPDRLGQSIKIGRRGSMNATLTVTGTQGHSAYPHRADNPIPKIARMLDRLASEPLDEGSEHFEPSTLAITSVDVGNPATNVIPASASARFNIRYNDRHSLDSLKAWLSAPFAQRLPGVEHHATVIDNVLHDRMLVRNGETAALDLIAILASGLITAMAVRSVSPATAGLVTGGLVAGWAAICFAAFVAANLWLGFVFPTLAIVATGALETAARMRRERRSRREAERQRTNLARYFSPSIVQRLADSNHPFDIDRTQHAAILFADMVGSTRLTEGLTPSEAMDFLRQFHRHIEKAVFAHQGTLDRFLGDGAIACFGMPDPTLADAYNAVACARALGEDIVRWNEERGRSAPPVRIGIGLHYGLVLMGDIGGVRQFQFTVAGDAVNVASRLEGMTRTFGATVIASDAAIEAARAFADDHVTAGFTPLPMQQIRGRERPIGIWSWTVPDTCGGGPRPRETPQAATLLSSNSARSREDP